MGFTEFAPRDAGACDVQAVAGGLEFERVSAAHARQACIDTCVSGFTIRCDGRTY